MKECERKSAGSKITFAYTYVAQPLFLFGYSYLSEGGGSKMPALRQDASAGAGIKIERVTNAVRIS